MLNIVFDIPVYSNKSVYTQSAQRLFSNNPSGIGRRRDTEEAEGTEATNITPLKLPVIIIDGLCVLCLLRISPTIYPEDMLIKNSVRSVCKPICENA